MSMVPHRMVPLPIPLQTEINCAFVNECGGMTEFNLTRKSLIIGCQIQALLANNKEGKEFYVPKLAKILLNSSSSYCYCRLESVIRLLTKEGMVGCRGNLLPQR
ncbi:hypothetical protein V6N13_145818 [Hibiscus sabdariffa]